MEYNMASHSSLRPRKSDSLTPARQKALAEYKRQRRRVQKVVQRQKLKGYSIPDSSLNIFTYKRVKNLSTQRIKSINKRLSKVNAKLIQQNYERKPIENADNDYESIQKQILDIERQEIELQAKKKQLEISKKQIANKKESAYNPKHTNDAKFTDKQSAKDKENKERFYDSSEFSSSFQLGEIIIQRMYDIISQIPSSDKRHYGSAQDLKALLDRKIDELGKTYVANNLQNIEEDVIEIAQVAIFYEEHTDRHIRAMITLETILTGKGALSAQELKDIENTYEAQAYTNDID